MIPITENTVAAVAALIYNHAYDQDPDSGWMAGESHNENADWIKWSSCLIQALQNKPEASDEQVIAESVQCMKLPYFWNTISMGEDEEGQSQYSTLTEETSVAMPLVRDFLNKPVKPLRETL